MRKISRIFKCVAAVAVCAVAFTGCENYNKMMEEKPLEYIELASDNTSTAMTKSSFAKEYDVIENALKEGTAGISFDAEGIKFAADVYANEAESKSSQLYSLETEGNKVEIYVAENKDIIKIGEIGQSGEHVYEMNMKTMADDLAGSVFAPGSDSKYEMSQDIYDTFVEYFKQISETYNSKGKVFEENEEFTKVIDEIMNDVKVEKKADVTIGETETKANILTLNFDKADIEKILNVYADSLQETAEEGERIDVDTVMESISTMDIECVYYINSKTHFLMKMECKADIAVSENEETTEAKADITVTYGADPENSDEIVANLTVDAQGEQINLGAVIKKISENETETTISASMQGMTMEVVKLNFSRDGENYTISANVPVISATATVTGTLKTTSDSVEATVDKVSYAMKTDETEGAFENFNIKFYIKKGGNFDDRASVKNIFALTEEEIDGVVDNIYNDVMPLVSSIDSTGITSGFGQEDDYGTDDYDYYDDYDYGTFEMDESLIADANENAAEVYVAFSSALGEMSEEAVETYDFEFYNNASGEIKAVTTEGYELNVDEYLDDNFTGYYYVYFDSMDYIVNYVLWSENPIEYTYHYSEFDQEIFAEEGNYIGCYPIYEY